MYITDLVTQLKNIMPVVGLGFVLGVFYLLIRICRYIFFDNRVVIFLTDVIFVVCCTLSSFLLFVAVNNGRIRLYLILAEIVGFLSFSLVFADMIFMFVKGFVLIIRKALSPFLIPFKFVTGKFNNIKKKYLQNAENYKNKFKKLLKHQDKVLYNVRD